MAQYRPRVAIVGMHRQVPTALGIGPHVTCRQQFIDLVQAAGCLPLIIPPLVIEPGECLELVDGLVIPGGADLAPALYGEIPHKATSGSDPERDRWEIALLQAALGANRPMLCICRGMQLLNVALGGTLIQHLPDESSVLLAHERTDIPHQPAHTVHVSPGSRIAQALHMSYPATPPGEKEAYGPLPVNSIHHQGIGRLGEGLQVTATADDGVIEAVEAGNYRFVVGVQWHPELLADPRQRGLFSALAAALASMREEGRH